MNRNRRGRRNDKFGRTARQNTGNRYSRSQVLRGAGAVAAGLGAAAMAGSGVVSAGNPHVVPEITGGGNNFNVFPTGDSATDLSNVQWAVNNVREGGVVRLHAQNNITGVPTAFDFGFSGGVTVTRSVTITGVGNLDTKIEGGSYSFRIEASGSDVTFQNLWFDKNVLSGMRFHQFAHGLVENCKFTDTIMTGSQISKTNINAYGVAIVGPQFGPRFGEIGEIELKDNLMDLMPTGTPKWLPQPDESEYPDVLTYDNLPPATKSAVSAGVFIGVISDGTVDSNAQLPWDNDPNTPLPDPDADECVKLPANPNSDIKIHHNEIKNCGVSGVGMWHVQGIQNLEIYENTITHEVPYGIAANHASWTSAMKSDTDEKAVSIAMGIYATSYRIGSPFNNANTSGVVKNVDIHNNYISTYTRGIVLANAEYCCVEDNEIVVDSTLPYSAGIALVGDHFAQHTKKPALDSLRPPNVPDPENPPPIILINNNYPLFPKSNNNFLSGNIITGNAASGVLVTDGAHDNCIDNLAGISRDTNGAGSNNHLDDNPDVCSC
jgi:hypothetical protein